MSGSEQIDHLIEAVEIREGWDIERDGHSASIDFVAVPTDRLERTARPGIDVSYHGEMWMLASHDPIGRDNGLTIDCKHLDDAAEAVENGMDSVEEAVGEELRDAHEPDFWSNFDPSSQSHVVEVYDPTSSASDADEEVDSR